MRPRLQNRNRKVGLATFITTGQIFHCCVSGCSQAPHFSAASAGPPAPSMFDEDDEGAPDAGEEEDGAASDEDAFVVAKPQVRVVERGCHCCAN